MTDQQWPWLEQPRELARMLAQYGGNAQELSRATGCPVGRIKRRRQKWLNNSELSQESLDLGRYQTQYMQEVWLSGNGTVSADWHLPITDFGLVEYLCSDAQTKGLTDWLVIAGDYFNMDALSDYLPKQQDAGLEPELVLAENTMRRVLEVFDRVYITLGNHDERLMRRLGYRLRFENSVRMCMPGLSPDELNRITTTGRDYVMIDSPTGPWRVCHTKSYSRLQLSVPAKLADNHRCNILGAHRHHHAMGYSPSGYRVGELGGLFDSSRTEYLTRYTTDFPHWRNGWFYLIDGLLHSPLLHAGCVCD